MARPITWQNVNIDNGSSAAAFGNTAANFAQGAVQGADVVNDMIKARMERDDTLLTNEAISQALSGGPKVSQNRRVDAEALQLAVERQALGQRQQEGHQDDLLTSAVNRRLNSANAGIAEKNLENYDANLAFEKKMQEARLAAEQARTANDTVRLQMAQTQLENLERIKKGAMGVTNFMTSGELERMADEEFDANWEQRPDKDTPEAQAQKAALRKQARQTYRDLFVQDPKNIYALGARFGLSSLETEQYTGIGRDTREAASMYRQAEAEQAVLNAADAKKLRTSAESAAKGRGDYMIHDGTDWTWGTGETAGADVVSDTLSRLGLPQADDKHPEVKQFVNSVKAEFPTASGFRKVMNDLIGKYGKDGIPDTKAYQADIRTIKQQLQQRAKDESKISSDTYQVTSIQDLINTVLDAVGGSKAAQDAVTPEQVGQGAVADLAAFRDQVQAVKTDNFTSRAEAESAATQLQTAVDGMKAQREELKPPKDASNELRSIYAQYSQALNVADGGKYIPQTGFAGRGNSFVIPQTPSFRMRKEHADRAAALLKDLLARQKQESAEAEQRSYQDYLNSLNK